LPAPGAPVITNRRGNEARSSKLTLRS
jgi:hypothetical protein